MNRVSCSEKACYSLLFSHRNVDCLGFGFANRGGNQLAAVVEDLCTHCRWYILMVCGAPFYANSYFV